MALKEEYKRVFAEYMACKLAERGVKQCCKAIVRKVGFFLFFAWDCASEGAESAVDNATWLVSELWQDTLERNPDKESEELDLEYKYNENPHRTRIDDEGNRHYIHGGTILG